MSRVVLAVLVGGVLGAASPPPGLPAEPADRAAIAGLLDTYTRAVSTKDEALFGTILLDPDISFSYVGDTIPASTTARSIRAYDAFRKAVFTGAPFAQRFENVRVDRDGALAEVSLTFRNRGAGTESWGFKTLQLLKVAGRWKIASEFFTVHDGAPPAKAVWAR